MARSTIYHLCSTGRVDPSYANIWGFTSKDQRNVWLLSKRTKSLYNQKYWRPGTDIKIDMSYEDSWSIDYVWIDNIPDEAQKQRTWYCFVTGREYVSNRVTRLIIDIDYVQTYFFDADGSPWWMANGYLGRATTPILPTRGVMADYPVSKREVAYFAQPSNVYNIVIYSTVNLEDRSSVTYTSAIVDGVLTASPPYIMQYNVNAFGDIIRWVNDNGLTDAINSVYIIPNEFVTQIITGPKLIYDGSGLITHIDKEIDLSFAILPYQPHNNVLKGYGFSYIVVNNNSGETEMWYPEDFTGNPKFRMSLSLGSTPTIRCVPLNFKGNGLIPDSSNIYSEKVCTPVSCGWLNDSYRIWLAQTQNARGAQINAAKLAIDQAQETRDKSMAGSVSNVVSNLTSTQSSPHKSYEEVKNKSGFQIFLSDVGEMLGDIRASVGNGIRAGASAVSGAIGDDFTNLAKNALSKITGIQQTYLYDQAIATAKSGMDVLLAGYRDQSSIPASLTGSNAYGDLVSFNQYGFSFVYYTPNPEWMEQLDKQIDACGHTISKWSDVIRWHNKYDYVQLLAADIVSDVQTRPEFVRRMMLALYQQGIYLWYVDGTDISDHIGDPYAVNNEVLS